MKSTPNEAIRKQLQRGLIHKDRDKKNDPAESLPNISSVWEKCLYCNFMTRNEMVIKAHYDEKHPVEKVKLIKANS